MKQLILIRHAKSSWNHPELSDHQRPLNKRGHRSIELLAQQLTKHPLSVDVLYSSSARRALATAEGLAALMTRDAEVDIADSLYTFDWESLWDFITELPEPLQSVALVGHNPALLQLYQQLSFADLDRLPTCTLLELELSVDRWCQLTPGCGQLSLSLYPKQPCY